MKNVTGSLPGALSSGRCELTLYVKEKVGANEGEDHNGDGQGTVGHHLSDFAIQIRTAESDKDN